MKKFFLILCATAHLSTTQAISIQGIVVADVASIAHTFSDIGTLLLEKLALPPHGTTRHKPISSHIKNLYTTLVMLTAITGVAYESSSQHNYREGIGNSERFAAYIPYFSQAAAQLQAPQGKNLTARFIITALRSIIMLTRNRIERRAKHRTSIEVTTQLQRLLQLLQFHCATEGSSFNAARTIGYASIIPWNIVPPFFTPQTADENAWKYFYANGMLKTTDQTTKEEFKNLNLEEIFSSRFIDPFFDEAKKENLWLSYKLWEATLSKKKKDAANDPIVAPESQKTQ